MVEQRAGVETTRTPDDRFTDLPGWSWEATYVEVEAGDYMWLRAFCPQACYAGGPGPFRYLLYKDVNRHVALTL